MRSHPVPVPAAPGWGVPVSRAQPTITSALVSTAAASTNPRLIRTEDLSFPAGTITASTTVGNRNREIAAFTWPKRRRDRIVGSVA
ncbi:hypothetical protein GCM10009609_03080 [Pseudonocardia aurantiaca]